MHLLNGLNSKFDNIINVIKHRPPPCTFNTARSVLKDEEDRLKTKKITQSSHNDHSSSPQVLIAATPPQQFHTQPDTPQPHFQYNKGGRGNRGDRGRGRSNNKGGRGGGNSNWQGNWNSNSPPPWAYPSFPQFPTTPHWPNPYAWPNTSQWPSSSPWSHQQWPQ
ncbi:hypothetical protein V5N11_033138 [Cardamine amara subsp. amara]|uniref:Uncharacterized protein n=1 Tax=Cardamine amara subsp. amara TaxID=228776 RepID=A0ABD1BLX2_CARAN